MHLILETTCPLPYALAKKYPHADAIGFGSLYLQQAIVAKMLDQKKSCAITL
jgi:hypothetical protein